MTNELLIIVLAAGKGTRTKTDIPKPLLPIMDKKLVDYVIDACKRGFKDFDQKKIEFAFVVGHESELVKAHIRKKNPEQVMFFEQKTQLGTGHALNIAIDEYLKLGKKSKRVLVLCADTPLLEGETLRKGFDAAVNGNSQSFVYSTEVPDPTGYGRIVRESESNFSIVEHKDCSEVQKKISEINTGVYVFDFDFIVKNITKLQNNNSSKEYYLTDLVKFSSAMKVEKFKNYNEFLGVNTLEQLSEAAAIKRKQIITHWQNSGVIFTDVNNAYISEDAKIGKNVLIGPNVQIEGNTVVAENVKIAQSCILKNAIIGLSSNIEAFTVIEDSEVQAAASVGPFARIRPGTIIGSKSKIGNFVEIKKSILASDVKVSHLSYVGDAEIGESSNIGCGFITCNYDGAQKHKTVIGDNCFIGSDSQMIAPVKLGNNCYVASGSTINQDMPEGSFAISRGRQTTKENLAKKFIKSKNKE
jgi:bifunctional UDP-N-acetylglucosamine pyrophosphorylase/glucosamine-1-phosphate N-acetyltransferase